MKEARSNVISVLSSLTFLLPHQLPSLTTRKGNECLNSLHFWHGEKEPPSEFLFLSPYQVYPLKFFCTLILICLFIDRTPHVCLRFLEEGWERTMTNKMKNYSCLSKEHSAFHNELHSKLLMDCIQKLIAQNG